MRLQGEASMHEVDSFFHNAHTQPGCNVERRHREAYGGTLHTESGANQSVGGALSASAPALPEETPASGCQVWLMLAIVRFWGFRTTGREVSLSTEPFELWAARLVCPLPPS